MKPALAHAWLTALTLCATMPARELLYNGTFELVPDSGWKLYTWGDFPDTGNCRLRQLTDFEPDRDFELMLHKMLHQGMKLSQRINLPALDLGFSVSARLTAKTERDSLFAAAAVCLEYLGQHDTVLGETRIYSATRGCIWTSTPCLHLIRAPDSLNWHEYRFRLQDELANLPAVNPDSITALRVALLAYVLGNS